MNRQERDQLWEQMRQDGWEFGKMLGIEGGGYAILLGDVDRIFHSPQEYAAFMQEEMTNNPLRPGETSL